MTQPDQINQAEMKRFLFQEFSEKEREAFEERFFADGDFFYDLMDLENELVDRYAIGKMSATENARFEKSLPKSPERREKVANSIALQTFIAEQKSEFIKPTFWEKIVGFFSFQKRIFQYSIAALLVFLMVGIGFLLFERARYANELARLQNQRADELKRQENELQEQIRQAQEREQNLQKELQNKNGQTEVLNEKFEREKNERLKLERELENLRREKSKIPIEKPKETQPQPQTPIIATLLPYSGGKGGGDDIKVIRIKFNTEKIKLNLQIPIESSSESFDIKLNGESMASGQKPFLSKSGSRVLLITLSTKKLNETEHSVTLNGNNETVRYFFRVVKQK